MANTIWETEDLRGCMEDYLRQRGVSVSRPFRCFNPSHEDVHPSMSYYSKNSQVHCFSCGVTYDLFDLIGLDYGIESFAGRVQKARELFGISNPDDTRKRHRMVLVPGGKEEKPLREPMNPLPDRTEEWLRIESDGSDPEDWALARGITAESCRKHRLVVRDGRIWFPVFQENRCTGWCGRAIEDHMEPRYCNSSGPLGLWNGDVLASEGCGGDLFITEGIVDALCLEQLGLHSISLCGSQNTAKLLRYCQTYIRTANTWRFVLCGDGDDAGREMNQKLGKELSKLGLSWVVLELTEGDDVADWYSRDIQWLQKRIDALPQEEDLAACYANASAGGSLNWFFREGEARRGRGALSTGLPGLDRALDGGLYPGLYVLGAISSLGKTSLALQIADYIAARSMDVLYISLEQSRGELIAKSLSRTSALLAERRGQCGFTVRQLLSGLGPMDSNREALLHETRKTYARQAGGLFLEEGLADIGPEEIRDKIRRHSAFRGSPPVVVVDYLQILRPHDLRATDKQNVDRAVVELKRISRDFDIPVLAVSSFNRENYRSAVSMESFKESGAVEYSADVLLGLQLEGAGKQDFDVNREKLRDPRRLQLVMLKNRNGAPYAVIPLSYTAAYSLFQPQAGAAHASGTVR